MKIGIVLQDNYFKNDSLISNIALGEKNIDRKRIIDSLKKANAWKFVRNLPNGIDEIILIGDEIFWRTKTKISTRKGIIFQSPNTDIR